MTVTTATQAHDVLGTLLQELPSSSSTSAISAALAAVPTADLATRSVISNLRLWPVPRALTVCFVGGSTALRTRVAQMMQATWPVSDLTRGLLTYDAAALAKLADCDQGRSDISVAFNSGAGHFSYVGAESAIRRPSMNFSVADEILDAELSSLVAHEVGHAIGLEHEHQSPNVPKCGWNFKYLGKAYRWDSDAQMRSNFDKLQDYIQNEKHAYVFSTYDKSSVMHYSFEPDAFEDGAGSACFVPHKAALPSDQDKNAIRVAYSDAKAKQALFRSAKPQFDDLNLPGPALSTLRELRDIKLRLMPSQ